MKLSFFLLLCTFVTSLVALPVLNPGLVERECSGSSCDHTPRLSTVPLHEQTNPGKVLSGPHSSARLAKRFGMGAGKSPREKPLLDIQQDKGADRRETKLARGVIGLVNFFGNSKVQQGIKDAFGKVKQAFINWGKDEKATRKSLREKKFNRGGKY